MSVTIDDIIKAAKLVSLPDLYIRLRAIISRDDFGIGEVAELIAHDPGMSARILKIVNSAFFGFPARIETVPRAVNMLGTQQVHDLVLATSITQTFAGISPDIVDMHRFWRKSVYAAIAARSLASLCNVLDSERLFVAGLLHDIGHLIMYQKVPEGCREAIERSVAENKPLFRLERELIGFDYAKVGGMMMREWNLPRGLWEAAEFQVEPANAPEHALEASLVDIASHLAEAAVSGRDIEEAAMLADPFSWNQTGLSPNQCPEVHAEVSRQMNEVMDLIVGPALRKIA